MRLFSMVFTILVLSACASPDVANRRYAETRLPSKSVSEIIVLYDYPNRPFKVIADFQSREKKKKLIERAAQIGADAIIISYVGGYHKFKETWAEEQHNDGTYDHILGTAIVFTDREELK